MCLTQGTNFIVGVVGVLFILIADIFVSCRRRDSTSSGSNCHLLAFACLTVYTSSVLLLMSFGTQERRMASRCVCPHAVC